jgi:hypothetical protein
MYKQQSRNVMLQEEALCLFLKVLRTRSERRGKGEERGEEGGEGRGQEEGRGKREEGRGKREEGRGKREEGKEDEVTLFQVRMAIYKLTR